MNQNLVRFLACAAVIMSSPLLLACPCQSQSSSSLTVYDGNGAPYATCNWTWNTMIYNKACTAHNLSNWPKKTRYAPPTGWPAETQCVAYMTLQSETFTKDAATCKNYLANVLEGRVPGLGGFTFLQNHRSGSFTHSYNCHGRAYAGGSCWLNSSSAYLVCDYTRVPDRASASKAAHGNGFIYMYDHSSYALGYVWVPLCTGGVNVESYDGKYGAQPCYVGISQSNVETVYDSPTHFFKAKP